MPKMQSKSMMQKYVEVQNSPLTYAYTPRSDNFENVNRANKLGTILYPQGVSCRRLASKI